VGVVDALEARGAGGVGHLPAAARAGERPLLVIGVAAVVYAQSAQLQAAFWRDSITLWTRAVTLTPDNDIARYNLALARLEAGQVNAAMSDLEALLRLVPDHAPARAQLNALVADRESAAGDRAAAAGQFFTAVTSYDRALAAEPTRLSVRLKRGMARAQAGEVSQAVPDLEAATAGATPEPAVANALAFGYAATGRAADGIALLRRARTAHPDDVRAPVDALEIAAALNDRSGGHDPRVLDTLALALDATGHRADARAALDVAIGLARTSGDTALATALTERRAALGR
jgi:tetratricopeptide (TPR) repeat protein